MAMAAVQQLPVAEVYTDGSIRRKPQKAAVGPPMPGGCAWVVRAHKDEESPVGWIGRYYALGDQTDNEYVELLAIALALECLLEIAERDGSYASQFMCSAIAATPWTASGG